MDKIAMIAHKVDELLVEQRQSDGYINATALSKVHKMATGKRRDVSEWLENKRTKETINHLSSRTGIPVIELYQVFQGSPENGGGTWIHPQLAVRFGIWLSDEFGYLVEQWVEQWLTGESSVLHSKVMNLENKLEIALQAIASLQSQIQTLLPTSANYIAPGWDPEVWHSLPPQDKRHFRFLHRRRGFRPSNQGIDQPLELPAITTEQIKQKQHDEFQQVVGEILEEEKKCLEVIKRELLNQFWAEGGES